MAIEKLRARLAEIAAEAQSILDAADADNSGVMDAEQEKKFDALMAEKDKVTADLKRREQMEGMSAGQGRQTPAARPASARVEVRHGFEDDPMSGFSSAAEFGLAVKAASLRGSDADERLRVLGAPADFHRETGSTDGYMVPPAMRQEIWQNVFQDEGILASVNPEPTQGNSVGMLTDETTPWGATGVQAYWASEGSQLSASKLATKMSNMQLHKLHAFVLATDEILEDAPRLNARLTVGASQAIRFKADQAIVEGDGVGKPLGWMKSSALVTVSKESGQAANTINATNVANMYSRLLMSGAQGAYWLVNQNTLPQLITMTIGDQPIWTPPTSGMAQAPGGMLLGLPIRFSEHAAALGTLGDIQLIAPRGYYAANKAGGIKFAASMHLYFDYDIEAFRWTFRLGGQPFLSAPVTANKGDTKSHFIVLQTRS